MMLYCSLVVEGENLQQKGRGAFGCACGTLLEQQPLLWLIPYQVLGQRAFSVI